MNTFYIFISLIIFFCFLLILVIMVQNPKGGGLSSSFGGGGSQQMGGVQKTTDFLDRSTWILGATLLLLILLSNIALDRKNETSDSKLIEEINIEERIPEEVLPNNSIPEVKD